MVKIATNKKTPAISKIFSRWLPEFSRSVADQINLEILQRYEIPPRSFTFQLPHDFSLKLGESAVLKTKFVEDCSGITEPVSIQVTSISDGIARKKITCEEIRLSEQTFNSTRSIVIENDSFNINLRELYDLIYANISENLTINVIITSGTVIGSTSVDLYALRTGTGWPAGTAITITNNGRIAGKGGNGGSQEDHGQKGGDALLVEESTTLDNVNGQIWGGGGGGAGTATDVNNSTEPNGDEIDEYSGFGGGGGAGTNVGTGGHGSLYIETFNPNTGAFSSTTQEQNGAPGNEEFGGAGGDAGNGGDAGQPGQSIDGYTGGAAGRAIIGSNLLTISSAGDIRGAQL